MALIVASFVIDKLKDPLLQETSLLYGVSGKVDSVTRQLEYIKAALETVEKIEENKTAQIWVDQVREVAFRIEDAIDIYHMEVKEDGTTTSTHGGCRPFGSFVKLIKKNCTKLVARHNLGVELSDIEATLKQIKENKEMFNFDESDARGSSHLKEKPARHNHQLEYFDETKIVGLENDKKDIVKKLLDAKVQNVISIVGTGGLGKTTLARKVFNSTKVMRNFNVRIWLSVSQEFNTVNILKKMLRKIRENKHEEVKQEDKEQDDEDYFIGEIRNSLKRQRFLIVLDDVWDQGFWPDHISYICPPDNEMDQGRGRVLITTRDHNVADKAHSELHLPQILKLKESKELLYKSAFPRRERTPEGLDDVATEIAKKCDGLPLALIAVGGQLYEKDKHSQWRKVADNMNWHENEGMKCMKVLETSYDDMPIILKTCFMYLASFPEDYQINADSLARLWVAENLVSDEETGQNYLQQLAQRCLIIVRGTSDEGSIKSFCVHDLILDLAISKAMENTLVWVWSKEQEPGREAALNNARRASLQVQQQLQSITSTITEGRRKYNKRLRTLLLFFVGPWGHGADFDIYLSAFRLLIVLRVDGTATKDIRISEHALEKWFEELIHLRHLELRNCEIENKKIPESIGRLKNLVTLDCSDGMVINEVPNSVWSITTLRHLQLCVMYNKPVIHAPKQKSLARNLKTLGCVRLEPNISTYTNSGANVYDFPELRELCLLYNGPWIVDGLLKNLSNNLLSLTVIVTRYTTDNKLDDVVMDMRGYPFYEHLQCLKLSGIRSGLALQARHLPPHLTHLTLFHCTLKEDPMPELEQLHNLEILDLNNCELNCGSLTCSAGSFPRLQTLQLEDDNARVQEFSIAPGTMPMLKQLKMRGFQGLRNNVPKMRHLKMLRHFEWRSAPFIKEEIQAMRRGELQHIPSVVIRRGRIRKT